MYFFSTSLALDTTCYIEEVVVETDMSLLPGKDILEETFLSAPDIFQTNAVNVGTDNVYAYIKYVRSAVDRTYERSFNKLDNYFSYVGGIIGTVLGIIFIMALFSEKAYSLSIASCLFSGEEGKSLNSSGFHIGFLLSSWIKGLTDKLGCCKGGWKKTKQYDGYI